MLKFISNLKVVELIKPVNKKALMGFEPTTFEKL